MQSRSPFLQKFMDTWYIFTDGACEDGEDGMKVGGVGGVLVSSNGQYMQHWHDNSE